MGWKQTLNLLIAKALSILSNEQVDVWEPSKPYDFIRARQPASHDRA